MLAQTGVVGREGVALDVTGVGDEGSAVKLKSFYCSDVFGLYRMLFTIAKRWQMFEANFLSCRWFNTRRSFRLSTQFGVIALFFIKFSKC